MNNQQQLQPIRNESDLDTYETYINSTNTERGFEQTNTVSRQMTTHRDNNSYLPYENADVPTMLKNTAFMPAFLLKHIGKLMKIEFLLGDQLISRIGILLTVGANFVVLRQPQSSNTMICDLFSIKFVTVIPDNNLNHIMLD